CSKCGARIKADREWCLRCHAPLVAYRKPELPLPPLLKRLGGGTLIFGTVASLAIIVVAITLYDSNTSVDDRARPAPASAPVAGAPKPAPAQPAAGATAAAAPLVSPVAFLDAERRGTADFGNSDFATAKAKFEEALKGKPDDPEILNNIGLTLERMGQYDDAIERFAQAARINPKSWAYHFNLAHASTAKQDWDRAIAEYRAARDIFPDDYATQFNLAMTLHRKGDELAAVPEFQKAIQLAPSEASFHLPLAASFEKLGRKDDAKREYQQYLDMAPGAADAEAVRAHMQGLT